MSALRLLATVCVSFLLVLVDATGTARAAFESGIWKGDAYVSTDGKFQRCAIVGVFDSETDLGFGLGPSGVFEVYLINKTWTLEPGQAARITIKVDDRPEISGPFQVVSRDTLGTLLENHPELVKAFKAGSVATFSGFFGTVQFPLKGTTKAFAAMEKCVSEVKAGVQDGGKAAEARARLAKVHGADLFGLGPRAFAARVLMNLPNDQFAIPTDVQQAVKRWNAALVWRVPQGLGLVQTVSGTPSEEELRVELTKIKEKSCSGTLASDADLRLLPGGDMVLRHVEISCTNVGNGKPAYEVMTFYPHSSGNLIVTSHIAETLEIARTADLTFVDQVGRIAAQR